MDQLDRELTQTKKKIERQEGFMVPRLERQLAKIDNDMTDLEDKRSVMICGGSDFAGVPALSPDRVISRMHSGNNTATMNADRAAQVTRPSTQMVNHLTPL